MTMDAIFKAEVLQTDNVFGWTLGLVWMVTAVLLIPLLVMIVQRARQVLDFVLTLHGCHLLFCCIYEHQFPWTMTWWIVQGLTILIMTLGGEWACMRHEMKPIFLMGSSSTTSPPSRMTGTDQRALDEDDTDEPSSSHKPKRKVSDAERRDQHTEKGPLTEAVGKARKVILDRSQQLWSANNDSYETIPMSSMPSSS
ncbi:hypothetical protein DM01DRAFT_1338486 [Hesseltinella vesiculosa]|uniref:Integral membrane protein n=1 Tax=Hesseltinella vesiculosa TaxID=101127 RepID=A0A1X2GA57_9FUNG|nr:hypothetical protein DM01DRAFT_1338486 [Hesseltinella vesiculosa]